ncbi:MAG TPA: hypothetical protein VF729_02115 [Solirubrobacterales bacterium]
MAGDPGTGHVYVTDRRNARISQYTAWGLFVKAWGWNVASEGAPGDTPVDELETCGPSQPEGSPPPGLCQKGLFGEGKGQFALLAGGIAVDDAGNVWVGDLENHRVQKFSPAGEFLLLFGGDVNKTKVEAGGASEEEENVCPFDPGDVCQAGTPGPGPSHLANTLGDYIAYNPNLNAIMVGDKDRIQVFDLDGSYREQISFEGELDDFAGKTVDGLDIDPDGNLYLIFSGDEDVFKSSPTGVPLSPGEPGDSDFKVKAPSAVGVDEDGRVYAVEASQYVLGFDAAGTPIEGMEAADEFAKGQNDIRGVAMNQCVGSEDPNIYVPHYLESFGTNRSYVSAYGPGPVGCEPPPKRAPVITDQYATSAGREEATVRAEINPKFWADTTYQIEYGTGKCLEGGCGAKAPLLPTVLTDKVLNSPLRTAGVVLEGLEPDTTYHYRFVAQSTGGGPVFGVDPDGEGPLEASPEAGLAASFRTFGAATALAPCANDAVRAGPSASLPDCRAYEMVSPLDKENADVASWIGRNNLYPHTFEIDQSAISGDRFTYTSATAFDDPESAPFASQYLAERTAGGWESKSISPPRTESPINDSGVLLSGEFRGFVEDLCSAWIRHSSVHPLAAGGIEGFMNLYRLGNCEEPPSYEAITTVQPPQRKSSEYKPALRGFSEDGTHAIFAADDKLHADAPSLQAGEQSLYEHTSEEFRFVCYLPSGQASTLPCSAGTLVGTDAVDLSSLRNAISADGSRIFFTTYSGSGQSNPGTIYVRVSGQETVALSGPISASPAFFWMAANDGSRVIFSFDSGPLEGHLYEVDIEKAIAKEADAATLIATGVEGPMGASEDASRIYFASSEDLDGGGPASTGAHSLYLYQADLNGGGGTVTFVMALEAQDVGPTTATSTEAPIKPISLSGATRAARVSPDGNHALFMSSVSPTPTGFDNTDAFSGEPDAEVYLYDAVEEELRCVSCNPTGVRPSGVNLGFGSLRGAARIQGWEFFFHEPRVLSDDGTRVFFESHEALVPRDTNGTWDVYQWEEAGKGSCTEADSTFSPTSGGCVDLISSGQSPAVSVFLDADPSGENVFIGTQSSLVGADYGLNDVYDARVGGGFPEPDPPGDCVEGGCQSPPPPTPGVTPASESSRGQGNATPGRKGCPKGKRRVVRKGKARCVKRKSSKKQRKRGARRR